MDFGTSEEEQAIRELARQILSDRLGEDRLKTVEASDSGLDRDLWKTLAEANLLGVALPESAGGMGLGFFELCILLEEQGRHVAPLPLLSALVLSGLPIAAFGSEAQRSRWLAPLAAGDSIPTAALSESGGGDFERPATRARPDGASWRIEGTKTGVPFASAADAMLVSTTAEDGGTLLFLIDPSSPGVTLEAQRATNRERQCQVRFDAVVARPQDLLGDPARGAWILAWIRDHGRVALSALALGVAEEALRRTAEYTSMRQQFGHPIGAFQGVSLRVADAYIDVDAMRSTYWQAAWKLAAGQDAAVEAAVAKWWACRGGQRVVHTAMHLHGGIGADIDYPLHRYFLWARQLELALGGASEQLLRIGASLPETVLTDV